MRQGQFFMLGTVLLAGLIFGVVSITSSTTDTTIDTSQQRFFQHMQDEFPVVVGNAMQRENDIDTIERDIRLFMRFIRFTEQQRGLDSNHYLVVGLKTSGGYDVTVGNFQDTAMQDVDLTIGNTTQSISSIESTSFQQLSFSPSDNRVSVVLEANQTHEFVSYGNSFSLLHSQSRQAGSFWQDTKINR